MRMRKGSRFDSRATTPRTGSSHCRISRFTIRSAAVIWSWRMDKRDTETLGGVRSTERASPGKDAYSGLRFDNHF